MIDPSTSDLWELWSSLTFNVSLDNSAEICRRPGCRVNHPESYAKWLFGAPITLSTCAAKIMHHLKLVRWRLESHLFCQKKNQVIIIPPLYCLWEPEYTDKMHVKRQLSTPEIWALNYLTKKTYWKNTSSCWPPQANNRKVTPWHLYIHHEFLFLGKPTIFVSKNPPTMTGVLQPPGTVVSPGPRIESETPQEMVLLKQGRNPRKGRNCL